jgi:anti-anti-sigma regulatory factor
MSPTRALRGCQSRLHQPQEDREVVVGDPLILTLRGEVDVAVTDPLRGAWYRVAEHAEHEMINIDLREVTLMDARGLGMLNRQVAARWMLIPAG